MGSSFSGQVVTKYINNDTAIKIELNSNVWRGFHTGVREQFAWNGWNKKHGWIKNKQKTPNI